MNSEGKKFRISKKSGAVIPKPKQEFPSKTKRSTRPKNSRDTDRADVMKKTYEGENFVNVYKDFMKLLENKKKQEKLFVFKK